MRRTEGWPAGLYLAALSLREQPDSPPAAIARFGGDDRIVSDYVADTLLADLPPEQVAFLQRTSVLDRLSGPLCDAVLSQAGSAGTLRDLARANALVVRLDRTDEWYRYHGLLAQMLRAELRRREPQLEAELHRRASRWHAEHDDVDAAIRHAAAAGDARLAGDLLWTNAFRYIPQGHNATVRRWLGHFTDEEMADHAPLALVAANAHLADGDRDHAEHWTAAAARALDRAPAGRRAPELEAGIAAMRAAIARDGVQRMRDDAARAYALEAEDGPGRAMDRLLEGTACHLLGMRERASALLREGSRRGVVAAPSVNALCLSQLALLAIDLDDWGHAAELADRARAQLDRFRLAGYPTMSLVLAVAALTQAQRGRVQTAKEDAAEAARLLDAMDDFAPWYVAQVRIVLAQVALRLSDVVGARALIEAAGLAVRATPEAPVLAEWLEEASSQVDDLLFGRGRCAGVADHCGAADPGAAADPPLLPGDGYAPLRVAQHGQDAGAGGLPQARRVVALGGRGPGARARPARAVVDAGPADRDVPARPRVGRVARVPGACEVVVEVRQLDQASKAPRRARRVRDAQDVQLVGLAGLPRQ